MVVRLIDWIANTFSAKDLEELKALGERAAETARRTERAFQSLQLPSWARREEER